MSQNNEWPDWITATAAVLSIIAAPVGLIMKRLFASVTRKEFKDYLENRDKISEDRHKENLDNFRELFDMAKETHGRLSYIEGKMEKL